MGAIDALVEAGANIEAKTNLGRTPLFDGAYYCERDSMHALLRRGAAVNVSDSHGETPLHKACFGKCPGLEVAVDLLLRWGADERASDKRGRTPADLLDSAAVHGPQHQNCLREEVERTRLLLARAPHDRAWRRRCWLVMLRWRASREKARGPDNSDDGDGGGSSSSSSSSSVGGGGGGGGSIEAAGESRKVPRTGSAASISTAVHSSHGRTNNGGGDGVEAGGAEESDGGGGLSGLVSQLVGLELEGVFRAVMGFL